MVRYFDEHFVIFVPLFDYRTQWLAIKKKAKKTTLKHDRYIEFIITVGKNIRIYFYIVVMSLQQKY
jgi:hypothetical protein